MSVLTAPAATTRTGSLVLGGLAATAVASVATSTVAAAGNAVGISLDLAGNPVPIPGFATLTALFSVIGLVIALVLSRAARRPRTAFVRTTIVLTALSLVPDVLVDAATATKLLLMVTHLVAAAIVVPVIARRLAA
ncbi:DUF6069 family protein [Actinomycetospora chiangmaiensis]|uniref:DUF6069 family protein n=1 Tax=Actinomycetospora chiangmaiensis TaxID=402650 RepID=UPI00036BC1E6|nr:DUF6069 family protein [Actinomycetospora chiangmaiensis]